MAIRLFKRRNFEVRDDSERLEISVDVEDLDDFDFANKTSSIQMDAGDRALFFTRRGWDGRVMARTGASIARVGRVREGGKSDFNDNIRSVRLSNFFVDVFYHIIRDGAGRWPGSLSESTAAGVVNMIHASINTIWDRGFLTFHNVRTDVYRNSRFFDLSQAEFRDLRDRNAFNIERAAINAFLVDQTAEGGGFGARLNRLRNEGIVAIDVRTTIDAGRRLAHEIGHLLGLKHVDVRSNLMWGGPLFLGEFPTDLDDKQVERVHEHIARRGGPGATFRLEESTRL